MEKTRKRSRNAQSECRDEASDTSAHLRLDRLRRSFAAFRRKHRPRTRIPQALRNAALVARQSGIDELEILRACSISSAQLTQWQQHQGPRLEKMDLTGEKARVFSVVDEMPGINAEPTNEQPERDLELRLGGWAICIRKIKG